MAPGRTEFRLDYLDGLRGVAATMVVAYHIILALVPAWGHPLLSGSGGLLRNPLAVFWSGPFAVSIFFVLSGFVVTQSSLRRSDPLWLEVAIRYLRLAVPATASTLLACALLSTLPDAASSLKLWTGSDWLDNVYQGIIPGPRAALFDGAVHVFASGGSAFNNALWTMRPELIGSVVCFVACLRHQPAYRLAIAAAAGVGCLLTHRSDYLGFALGIGLREAWAADLLPSKLQLPILLAGLLLGSQAVPTMQAAPEQFTAVFGAQAAGLLAPLGATLIVAAVLVSPALRRALSSRPGRWLGAISFPLYLVHVPIICTVLASLIVAPSGPLALAAALGTTLASMLVIAHLAERWLERPLLQQLKRLRAALRVQMPRGTGQA